MTKSRFKKLIKILKTSYAINVLCYKAYNLSNKQGLYIYEILINVSTLRDNIKLEDLELFTDKEIETIISKKKYVKECKIDGLCVVSLFIFEDYSDECINMDELFFDYDESNIVKIKS